MRTAAITAVRSDEPVLPGQPGPFHDARRIDPPARQHATRERDRKIADGLSEQIKAACQEPANDHDDEEDGHATGTGSASGA